MRFSTEGVGSRSIRGRLRRQGWVDLGDDPKGCHRLAGVAGCEHRPVHPTVAQRATIASCAAKATSGHAVAESTPVSCAIATSAATYSPSPSPATASPRASNGRARGAATKRCKLELAPEDWRQQLARRPWHRFEAEHSICIGHRGKCMVLYAREPCRWPPNSGGLGRYPQPTGQPEIAAPVQGLGWRWPWRYQLRNIDPVRPRDGGQRC
jgi:hypothetical protein